MNRVNIGILVLLPITLISITVATVLAQDIIVAPDSCASVRWEVDAWAQLTVDNRCAARVMAHVHFAEGGSDLVSCHAYKTCKSSHPKEKARHSFQYCLDYEDYELKKKFGHCR